MRAHTARRRPAARTSRPGRPASPGCRPPPGSAAGSAGQVRCSRRGRSRGRPGRRADEDGEKILAQSHRGSSRRVGAPGSWGARRAGPGACDGLGVKGRDQVERSPHEGERDAAKSSHPARNGQDAAPRKTPMARYFGPALRPAPRRRPAAESRSRCRPPSCAASRPRPPGRGARRPAARGARRRSTPSSEAVGRGELERLGGLTAARAVAPQDRARSPRARSPSRSSSRT